MKTLTSFTPEIILGRLPIIVLSLMLTIAFSACSDDDSPVDNDEGTIVEVAQANENFSILATAIVDAGLATTLDAEGPFTVFAPTNAAFGNLPDGLLESLSQAQLAEILSYHVIQSEVASTDLQAEQAVATVAGGQLFVTVTDGEVIVNDNATVIDADIPASNGIIHAVDQVLLPDSYLDVVGIIAKRYTLQTLEEAVVAANLAADLQQDTESGYTVFAPANEAFEGIDLSALSQEQLQSILTYHVLPTAVLSSELSSSQTVTTVNGATLQIDVASDGTVSLTDQQGNVYQVTQADLEGTNGVVHIINGVLMPS